jgi:fibronectin type 3 domain-containing protein
MKRFNGIGEMILMLLLGVSILSSCSKDHEAVAYKNPIDTGQESVPPVPDGLQVRVGDRTVILTWEVSDTSDVQWYRIARKDSSSGDFFVVDSVSQRIYRDTGLRNGRLYRYRVCVINLSGYIGSYSHEIGAVPSGFTITINGGDLYTNAAAVSLTLSAPGGAGYIMLANDSLFSGASWEPFVTQKTWTLTGGDGTKEVFLKVRDLDDNESWEIYQDDIILDTQASIESVTFTPIDSLLSPGDRLHFSMETGEDEGQASLDIGAVDLNRKLYDDGTHGDGQADDGLYELDFTIPGGLEVIDAVVRGHFVDRADNQAEEVSSVNTLTIQQSPQAVQLLPPSLLPDQTAALHLAWSQNQDDDFAAYRLYRSLGTGVESAADRHLVADISSRTTTGYDDTDLEENTTYYYQIAVYDQYGLYSFSNEVSATTGQNEEPQPVTLLLTSVELTPGDSTTAEIELKWTRSQESDFSHYLVYRDEQSPVDENSTPVELINDSGTTTYSDTQLPLSTRYYYRVYVCDEGDLCAGSNEVNAMTPTGP